MLYLTHTVTPDRTLLIVGKFYDDGVLALTPDRQILRVPRCLIETPVLCCKQCRKPALLLRHPHTHKDYTECPDIARHKYEELYAASIDTNRYNRKQRHVFTRKAKHWLNKWRQAHAERTTTKAANS